MGMLLLLSTALALPDQTLDAEASLVLTPGEATHTLGARALGERNGYADLLWRVRASGDQVLRAGTGIDVLSRSDRFDIHLGLALGGAGDWRERAIYPQLGAGFQAAFQVNVQQFHLRYSKTTPILDTAAMRGLDEREFRAQWDLTDRLAVFGSALQLYPDLDKAETAWSYGVGASWRL